MAVFDPAKHQLQASRLFDPVRPYDLRLPPAGLRSIEISVSVCLFVCLSARIAHSHKFRVTILSESKKRTLFRILVGRQK